jgi:hypothetical protein
MSYSCAEWRGEIGAYIVGALDGPARARVGRHLVACAGCRADYDELTPVRGWLSQLASADGSQDFRRSPDPRHTGRQTRLSRLSPSAACPGAPPEPHLLRAAGPGRTESRRRNPRAALARGRRWLLAAGTGLAAGAAAAAVLVAGPSSRTYQAVSSATGVSGHAELHSTPTGTEIELTASGLPAGERCILVAVARSGTDIAGTWGATYSGSARIAGTSAYPPSQLMALRIESDSGLVLLSIRL